MAPGTKILDQGNRVEVRGPWNEFTERLLMRDFRTPEGKRRVTNASEEMLVVVMRPKAGPKCEECGDEVELKYQDPIQVIENDPDNPNQSRRFRRGLCVDDYLARSPRGTGSVPS